MRLSEAILAGSTLIKWRGGAVRYDDGSGCAIGMAYASHGIAKKPHHDEDRIWPWIYTNQKPTLKCPCNCEDPFLTHSRYYNVIAHIFDLHIARPSDSPWTLEQLVDWVRSVEPNEDPQQEPQSIHEPWYTNAARPQDLLK